MNSDQVQILLVATACAVAVGLAGLALAWAIRHQSIFWQLALVVGVAIGSVLAGVVAIARLMFISPHDRGVVTLVSAVLRRGRPARGGRRRRGPLALVGGAAPGRPPARHPRLLRRRSARPERAAGALGRAGAHQPTAGGVPAARGAAGGLAARAGLVGLPRPAHAAGRHARDGRGARGRHGRGPGALPPPDPRRGRPDGADGRRPLRAVAHPCRRTHAEPGDGRADRRRQRGDRRRRPDGAGAVGAARRAASSRGSR